MKKVLYLAPMYLIIMEIASIYRAIHYQRNFQLIVSFLALIGSIIYCITFYRKIYFKKKNQHIK